MAAFSKSRTEFTRIRGGESLAKLKIALPLITGLIIDDPRGGDRGVIEPGFNSPSPPSPPPARNFVVFAVRLPRECVKQCVEKRPIPNLQPIGQHRLKV